MDTSEKFEFYSKDEQVLEEKQKLGLETFSDELVVFSLAKGETFADAFMIAGIIGDKYSDEAQNSISKIALSTKIPSDVKQRVSREL